VALVQYTFTHKQYTGRTTQNKQYIQEPTRCNNDLLIYKISSTCFGQNIARNMLSWSYRSINHYCI